MENIWKQIWDKHKNDIPSINSMSSEIGNDILKWTHNLEGKNSLEVDSGTGIISSFLAKRVLK